MQTMTMQDDLESNLIQLCSEWSAIGEERVMGPKGLCQSLPVSAVSFLTDAL